MRIIIDSDIVKQYIEKADNDELSSLFEKTDSQSMENFVARYLQKLQLDNPEKFNHFIGIKEQQRENLSEIKNKSVKEPYMVGDIVFKVRQSFGGYILDGYDKFKILDIKPSYIVIGDMNVVIRISNDMFKQMIKTGEIYIFRRKLDE